jgi:hypothetical protein
MARRVLGTLPFRNDQRHVLIFSGPPRMTYRTTPSTTGVQRTASRGTPNTEILHRQASDERTSLPYSSCGSLPMFGAAVTRYCAHQIRPEDPTRIEPH